MKDKIMKLFLKSYERGLMILDLKNSKSLAVISLADIIILIISVVGIMQNISMFKIIALISGIVLFIILIIYTAWECMSSVTGFLGTGTMFYIIFILFCFCNIRIGSFIINIIICYIISAVTWWYYSLIANNKVASTANEILSAIFGILILLKDTLIAITPARFLDIKIGDFTYEKYIEMISSIIFSPLLVVNIIALLLCVLKGYWIEKYNNNQDVGYEYTDSHEEEN